MMISVWHLLWVIPASTFGFVLGATMRVGAEYEKNIIKELEEHGEKK